jgi:hypothetical protein
MAMNKGRVYFQTAAASVTAALLLVSAQPANARPLVPVDRLGAPVARGGGGGGDCPPGVVVPTASLPDTGAVLSWSLQRYGIQAHYSYWSVIATRGSQGYDADIKLLPSSAGMCESLATSVTGDFIPTDWVAFDANSGRLPAGTYIANVIDHPVNTSPVKFDVQFVDGHKTLSTTAPLTDQAIGTGYTDWLVDIRDVWLNAGSSYTFKVTGSLNAMYLLGSDPAYNNTWTQTMYTASPSLAWPGTDPTAPETGTVIVHPTQSAWYGALFVRNGWWGSAVTVRVSTP